MGKLTIKKLFIGVLMKKKKEKKEKQKKKDNQKKGHDYRHWPNVINPIIILDFLCQVGATSHHQHVICRLPN